MAKQDSKRIAMRHRIVASIVAAVAVLGISDRGVFGAEDHITPIMALVESKIWVLVLAPEVVAAVKAQNEKNASLDQATIDSLDLQWRTEVDDNGGPLSTEVLANALSVHLKQVKDDNGGLFTEIFVMDNKGLNVGQSDLTSDYWQGDEAKWQKTFPVGPTAVFVDAVELDESPQTLQAQVSLSIVDLDSETVIGAATFGIDVEALE